MCAIGIWWVEAREVQNLLPGTGQHPTTKRYPSPNIDSAWVENPYVRKINGKGTDGMKIGHRIHFLFNRKTLAISTLLY